MAKSKKSAKKPDTPKEEIGRNLDPVDVSRENIEGWSGGAPLKLSAVDKETKLPLRDKLTKHIGSILDQELLNHSKVKENLAKWQRQYQGKKQKKEYPYPGAANVAVPITRSNVDTVLVRMMDALFNKRKFFICRAKKPELVDVAREIEEFLDYYVRNIVKLKKKIRDPLLQSIKMGSGWAKMPWEQKTRSVYRYASEPETFDTEVKKYKTNEGSQLVKDVETLSSGPNIYPISREDIVYSAGATSIQDAYLFGFKTELRRAQLDVKVKQGLYDKDAVLRITSPDTTDQVKEGRADNQGLEVRKSAYEEPYSIWELWLKYDVDGDGEEDDIVVTYHRESGQILRAIYNPIFYGFRPFIMFGGLPVEFSLEGEGLCSVLESLQEEIDAIHNQRLDRITQINAPMYLVQKGSGLDNFKLNPGKVWFTDGATEEVLREVEFANTTYSNFQEEDRLTALADRASGNSPELQGISTSERPVASETLARVEELNKKFKYMIDNYRDEFAECGYMIIEMFAQYQPRYTYRDISTGQTQEKTVNFPTQMIRDGLEIELFASTEMLSQEVRREINMTVYGLLGDFKTKAAGTVQAIVNPMVPSDFKKWLIAEYTTSLKVIKRILEDFDIRDGDELVNDLDEILDLMKNIQNSIDIIQAKQQMMGGGGEPEGGPPGMPPEGGMAPGMPPMAPPM